MYRHVCAVVLVLSGLVAAQNTTNTTSPSQQKIPPVKQTIEVTATRIPEDPAKVPAAIEVFTGDELSMRGATDLRSSLALATGVEIAPGGDNGPASSVPDFWGLKEFDAFLLAVDGSPWGGAFNPALSTLSLEDIDRIEVLRGPAPVTYGATSFVGVIHVIHKAPDQPGTTVELNGGAYGTGGGMLSTRIPLPGEWSSRLTVDGDRQGFRDDRTSWRRGHGLWRIGQKSSAPKRVWFNADVNWLDQNPASPRPLDDETFVPLSPVDVNLNPAGAFLNDHRFTFMGGFDRDAGKARWSTSATFSHSRQDLFRGFLQTLDNAPDNGHGLREKIHLTDFYVDSHFSWKLGHSLQFLAGADYLHGTGNAHGADFDYDVPLSGVPVPRVDAPADLDVGIRDHRDFVGPYASVEWTPFERLLLSGGARLNITRETQSNVDAGAGTSEADERTPVRASGNLGALFNVWQGQQDSVALYANYRDTFKPAAIDFGIGEDEEETGGAAAPRLILAPETSRSIEGGLKARLFQRRMEAEVSGFYMRFNNLVSAASIGGVPALINTGKQRFAGFESSVGVYLRRNVIVRGTYSVHDAIFTNFVQDFDGVPMQLAGHRLEMSARQLAAFGLVYAPERGFGGAITLNYTGNRYLNRENTGLAGGFATLDINAGYRRARWEIRVYGRNLSDARDPVATSELGEGQYYLMPARTAGASLRLFF